MSRRATLVLTTILLSGMAAFLWAQPAGRDANGRPPQGPPVGDGDFRPVTEQQETELLGVLAEVRPEEAASLRRLKEENPRAYRARLQVAWRAYQVWRDLPPEMRKLWWAQQGARLEAWRQAQNWQSAKDPSQKERIRARLLETLGTEFDAEQGLREHRLGQLEEQLKRLRAELKERAEHRTQVIEKNLQDLLASRAKPKPEGDLRRGPDAKPMEGRPFLSPTGTRPFAPQAGTRPFPPPEADGSAP